MRAPISSGASISSTPLPAAGHDSRFVSRRQFIQLGMAGLGAAWLGIMAQAWLNPPQSAGGKVEQVSFPLADLPVGSSKIVSYAGSPVVVLRTPESLRAYSLICTHLGCTVQWQTGEQEFYCPCHDGRFDAFGEVTAGPPPLPLEQIEARINGDKVVIGEEL